MKLIFIGDICTDSYSKSDVNTFRNTKLYHFLNNYEGIVIGNLEAPLLSEAIRENRNKYSLVNQTDLFDLYSFCDYFNLANNHILDQGVEGLDKTIDGLVSRSKGFFGAGNNLQQSREPKIIEINGKKIGILSYCCISSNSESYANNSSGGPSPLIYEYVKEDIDAIRKLVDHIIVLPHWGKENEFFPTYDQASIARKIIELGADVIIGAHTHTIQAFEHYKGNPIYYSLGNFLFNNFSVSEFDKYYQGKYNKEGLLVELDFSHDKVIAREHYVKLDEKMLPELAELEDLNTPVRSNNDYINSVLGEFEFKKLESNLNLSLKFNGQSMQVINESPLIGNSYKPRIESFKVKIKRYMIYFIKKALR
ncbi:TPA: hypothetical protein I7291_09415 [Vibrio parahaemolyticus]|nr:hypothetical protein [Vibrio parahaemolyticus]HAS6915503.1 hypothetical protein [Vibrio parahaemolyticus]HAS6925978.1 hypothetical protein [Vibrio parahaemolyticus]